MLDIEYKELNAYRAMRGTERTEVRGLSLDSQVRPHSSNLEVKKLWKRLPTSQLLFTNEVGGDTEAQRVLPMKIISNTAHTSQIAEKTDKFSFQISHYRIWLAKSIQNPISMEV